MVAAATRARSLVPVMGGIDSASGLWALLRREAPETVALAGGLGAREAARKWLEEVRGVRLAIDGDDLVAAGLSGPAVGRALDAAMGAALDGEAVDRDAQLRVALQRRVGAANVNCGW